VFYRELGTFLFLKN